MENLFEAAHKLTKEIKAEYPEVDYRAQFAICLSYLQNNREVERMDLIEQLRNEAREYRNEEKLENLKKINGENWNEEMERENIEIGSKNYFERRKKEVAKELRTKMKNTEDRKKRMELRKEIRKIQNAAY